MVTIYVCVYIYTHIYCLAVLSTEYMALCTAFISSNTKIKNSKSTDILKLGPVSFNFFLQSVVS